MKPTIPPEHLWHLPILTDAAVCGYLGEERVFVKDTDLDPAVFSRYCIPDVTYRMYRVLVIAEPPLVVRKLT